MQPRYARDAAEIRALMHPRFARDARRCTHEIASEIATRSWRDCGDISQVTSQLCAGLERNLLPINRPPPKSWQVATFLIWQPSS